MTLEIAISARVERSVSTLAFISAYTAAASSYIAAVPWNLANYIACCRCKARNNDSFSLVVPLDSEFTEQTVPEKYSTCRRDVLLFRKAKGQNEKPVFIHLFSCPLCAYILNCDRRSLLSETCFSWISSHAIHLNVVCTRYVFFVVFLLRRHGHQNVFILMKQSDSFHMTKVYGLFNFLLPVSSASDFYGPVESWWRENMTMAMTWHLFGRFSLVPPTVLLLNNGLVTRKWGIRASEA